MTKITQVYGGGAGNCLKEIGTGLFEIAPTNGLSGCALVDSLRDMDTQSASSVTWNLPAQNYTVTLKSNQPEAIQGEGVLAYFLGQNDVLPTQEQAGLTREVPFVKDADGESKFLFRVVPTLERKSVSPVKREDCLTDEDLIVVDRDQTFTIEVNLFEVYLGLAPICHNVSGSLVVAESVSDGGDASEVFVEVRTIGGLAVEAIAKVEITAGAPDLLPPHLKRVRIAYGQMRPALEQDWLETGKRIGKGRIKAAVLVEGDIELAQGQTFAIPEFVPFLILRDPPGDMSSASYASSHTATLNFGLSRETMDGFTEELSVGLVGLEEDILACLGLGAASCNKLTHGDNCELAGILKRTSFRGHSRHERLLRHSILASLQICQICTLQSVILLPNSTSTGSFLRFP